MTRFGDFELSEERWELRRGGAPVAVAPKVMSLLVYLVRHRDRVASQDELLRALWPDAVVTPASLARAVKEARRVLGDDGAEQRMIRTLPGRGYRFVAAVQTQSRVVEPATDYVGRPLLLAALDAAALRARSGDGRIVVLAGPAGIGKTRTAEELARRARELGMAVAWGHCVAGEHAPPLWPWSRALVALGARLDEPGAEDLVERARLQRFAKVADALAGAAARGAVAVVLDDLHEADSATIELLAFLADELRGQPILICVTLRADEIARRAGLGRVRARLARHDRVERHELDGLDASEVARLVEARAGAAPPPGVVADLHRSTSGNPFLIREIVRGGLDATAPRWSDVVPRGLGQLLQTRLTSVSEAARGVLDAAAVLGERFDLRILAELAAVDVSDALAETEEAGLARADPADAGRGAFTHALFRDTLHASLAPARRAELHARAAAVLEANRGGVEEVATHWLAAGAAGDPAHAARCAERAAHMAREQQDWERAAAFLEGALGLAGADTPAGARACDLWLLLADARERCGMREPAREAAERALALARGSADVERIARAVLAVAGPPFAYHLADAELSDQLAAAAAELAYQDAGLAARLHARRAAEHALDRDRERASALRRAAVETALASGDAAVLAEILMTPYSGIWDGIDPGKRLALADECLARGVAQGDAAAVVRGRMLRLAELLALGDLERFDGEIDAADELTVELHEPTGSYQILLHRSTRALAAGELAQSERLAQQALALGRRLDIAGAFELFTAQLHVVRREQGRLREHQVAAEPLFAHHPSPAARALFAAGYAEIGDVDSARAQLAALFDDDPRQVAAHPTGVANAALAARACFLLEERAPAPALTAILAPLRERVVVRGTVTAHGPGSYYLALLAWLDGREAEVAPLFAHARDFCRRMRSRGWGAQADYDAASWSALRGDLPTARDLAARAARAAVAIGMQGLAPAAAALRDRL